MKNTKLISFKSSKFDLSCDSIGSITPSVNVTKLSESVKHVRINYELTNPVSLHDWRVTVKPDFEPNFHWMPHLTPTENHIVDQHVFRSPALIISDDVRTLILIPDLDILSQTYKNPESHYNEKKPRWYLDLDALDNTLIAGLCNRRLGEHVLFVRDKEALHSPGSHEFGFYLMYSEDPKIVRNPWRPILEFFWSKWGEKQYEEGNPLSPDLTEYVKLTYDWAFKKWKEHVWQEFILDGKKVGAPVFLVNVSQSPNYKKPYREREFRSIWNQAWFSSLRSASGLYRYAKRTNNKEYLQKALLTKEIALSAPQKEGFFPSVIGTDVEKVRVEKKLVHRSRGWDEYFWGNSTRNPFTTQSRLSPYHILDMSFTALNMLRWYDELERDERLLNYSRKYADALIKLQDNVGFFPAWLDLENLTPLGVLDQSPETSLSISFLLKIFKLTSEKKYKLAALKAMDSIIENIIPQGKWEDFETYFSCSKFGIKNIGKKIERNNCYKQNSLSIFWTAEALLESYYITGEKKYLTIGQRVLDELLMMQASWQPPYIYIKSLGGFGVMNADGEWNDSRQSLFAELIVQYGQELNLKEYIHRGLAALRASFVMMYCPQNPDTKIQWEQAWDFFNEKDFGFMMENYGHSGLTNPNGLGMGDFTIYDWGNGAASEAFNRMIDHFGLDFLIKN